MSPKVGHDPVGLPDPLADEIVIQAHMLLEGHTVKRLGMVNRLEIPAPKQLGQLLRVNRIVFLAPSLAIR